MLLLMRFSNGIGQWESIYVTSLPFATNYKSKQTTRSSFLYILYEYATPFAPGKMRNKF